MRKILAFTATVALAAATNLPLEKASAGAHSKPAGPPFGKDDIVQQFAGLLGQTGDAVYTWAIGLDFKLAGEGANCRYTQSVGTTTRQVLIQTTGDDCRGPQAQVKAIDARENLMGTSISPTTEMDQLRSAIGPEASCASPPNAMQGT